DSFDCERGLDGIFQNVSSGQFNTRVYAYGRVHGAVRYDLGQIDAGNTVASRMHLCFGRSFDDLVTVSTLLTQSKSCVKETAKWWQDRYMLSVPRISSTTVRNVSNRSLITLNLLTDSQTGGILAAPECDPDFTSCGGYGFCWPRDGAFIGYI